MSKPVLSKSYIIIVFLCYNISFLYIIYYIKTIYKQYINYINDKKTCTHFNIFKYEIIHI